MDMRNLKTNSFMPIHFTKMHGAGNDFIVIDNRTYQLNDAVAAQFAKQVCHRRFGIGADGILLLDSGRHADFQMRYYNSDGSRSFCANGARCLARFAYHRGMVGKAMIFEADDGRHEAVIVGRAVRLHMTDPAMVDLNRTISAYPRAETVHSINTGTQHAVLHSDDVIQEDVVHHGRVLRQHSLFQPLGTNVNFVQTMDTSRIAVRTYEKGVEAETLSCGTGAVAAVAVMTLLDEIEPPVMVHTRSGETFSVNFTRNGSVIRGVTLEGSAHIVYDGEFLEENVD